MARIRAATNMFSQAVQTMKDKTVSSLSPIPGVVLVHGAYGSSWPTVIQCLQGAGLAVIALQNPLTPLDGTPRTPVASLALRPGPVILVEREA